MSTSVSATKRHKTKMPHEIRLSETQHLPLRFNKSQRRCNLCSTKKTWYQCPVCKVPIAHGTNVPSAKSPSHVVPMSRLQSPHRTLYQCYVCKVPIARGTNVPSAKSPSHVVPMSRLQNPIMHK